jgi:hypothetical protein
MNDEVGHDMSKLLILHDFSRWENFEVKEIEGFRIVRGFRPINLYRTDPFLVRKAR